VVILVEHHQIDQQCRRHAVRSIVVGPEQPLDHRREVG
jgi:hypothetical protein